MKKLIMNILCFLPVTAFALTCPTPSQVYIKEGSRITPKAPSGWHFQTNWPSYLNSDNVVFVLAAYGADLHPPTEADNHVRCYYGNPVLEPDLGVAIETDDVIPEGAVASHAEWNRHKHYYMCGREPKSVNDCPFG